MLRRVVLDTNVIVAALRSRRGSSAAVLDRVGTGEFDCCLSVALFLEYESAVLRPESGIQLPVAVLEDILDYLAAVGIHQKIHFLWRPTLADPADDHVLELAVAAGCDSIVTYNGRHFRGADRFGIRIIRPPEFLLELRSQQP